MHNDVKDLGLTTVRRQAYNGLRYPYMLPQLRERVRELNALADSSDGWKHCPEMAASRAC